MMTEITAYLFICGLSSLVFVAAFCTSWALSSRYIRTHFQQFTLSQKADWCSRINSTLHAFVIIPGLCVTIYRTKWDHATLLSQDVYGVFTVRCFMSISVAYFFVDLLVVVLYRVPMWIVFVIHHVVAFIPLAINIFDSNCPWGTFILALFLLVEVPTITLNAQVFLEQTGHANSRAYAVFFYLTYVLWILFRLALPVAMMYCLWHYVVPSVSNLACAGFGIAASHLLTLFCFGVFVFVLTKELKERWVQSSSVLEVAVIHPGRGSVDEETIRLNMENQITLPVDAGELGASKADEARSSVVPLPAAASNVHVNDGGGHQVEFPATNMRMPTQEDLQWGLGIDRPASVMRHGGAIIR